MAGSDSYRRTQTDQGKVAAETAEAKAFVQLAVVYRGKDITMYRDGKELSHYQVGEAQEFDNSSTEWTKSVAVMPEPIEGKVPNMKQWDPDCWLNGDTYYSISGGGNPPLMKSKDLQKWEYVGDLLHKDMPTTLDAKRAEDISFGNMFKIGNKWMLLCINHGRGCRQWEHA